MVLDKWCILPGSVHGLSSKLFLQEGPRLSQGGGHRSNSNLWNLCSVMWALTPHPPDTVSPWMWSKGLAGQLERVPVSRATRSRRSRGLKHFPPISATRQCYGSQFKLETVLERLEIQIPSAGNPISILKLSSCLLTRNY